MWDRYSWRLKAYDREFGLHGPRRNRRPKIPTYNLEICGRNCRKGPIAKLRIKFAKRNMAENALYIDTRTFSDGVNYHMFDPILI